MRNCEECICKIPTLWSELVLYLSVLHYPKVHSSEMNNKLTNRNQNK
jgi:hypothetical protein